MAPSRNAGTIASTISVAIGVILGAALTFCIQIYANRVEDQRAARHTRAQHIERLMIAAKNADSASTNFMAKLANVAAKMRDSNLAAANLENLMPDTGPVTELRAVSALYLPEAQPQAERLAQAYNRFCQELMNTYPLKLATYKSGDPTPKPDPKTTDDLSRACVALENKLIELAKKNRAD